MSAGAVDNPVSSRTQIVGLVADYHRASSRRLHLIPSESTMSLTARLPYLTDAVHRYCFPSDGQNWAWPGNDHLVAIEHAAVQGLRDLFGVKHINIKPTSGLSCMAVALSALSEPAGTVFSVGERDGGHGSTRFIAERLGLSVLSLPYDRHRFSIDLDQLGTLAQTVTGPKLVYLDQFMCLFPHDLAGIRAALGDEAVIHYDGSHVLGLIAGGQFQDPLAEGADCLGGSTHKSFPGPHKGIVMTNSDQLSQRIDEHAGHWVSHHHPADIAALAVTIAELRDDEPDYAARTVDNAQHLAAALAARGFDVCASDRGFTRSHQLWIDVARHCDPIQASQRLLSAGIVVNAIEVPYLAHSTGLRLGVQEVTRHGMDTADMDRLAAIFARLLIDRDDPAAVHRAVQELIDEYSPAADSHALEMILTAIGQQRKEGGPHERD